MSISSMRGVEPASYSRHRWVTGSLGEVPSVASSGLFGASQFARVLVVLAARWKIDSGVPQLTLQRRARTITCLVIVIGHDRKGL
jgi:hypothetical protein